jgi:hypothetical protein
MQFQPASLVGVIDRRFLCHSETEKEECTMKIKILGAAIMALSLTAAPALARHLTYSQGPTQSIFCATRQAGNPYSKYCDYMAWSGWRTFSDSIARRLLVGSRLRGGRDRLVAMTERPQKITFGEMRESRIRGVLIYCSDYKCSHYVTASADPWPDDLRAVRY